MPSLSSYDKGTAKIEGRRVRSDIESGNEAMQLLLEPIRRLQASQSRNRKRIYRPEMHFHIGNHEERILRYENNHPEVKEHLVMTHSTLSGWNVPWDSLWLTLLVALTSATISIIHNSGRPHGGTAEHRLNKIKKSFVQGHEQGFKYHIEAVGDKRIHGLVAGSFYSHEESYKGPQG